MYCRNYIPTSYFIRNNSVIYTCNPIQQLMYDLYIFVYLNIIRKVIFFSYEALGVCNFFCWTAFLVWKGTKVILLHRTTQQMLTFNWIKDYNFLKKCSWGVNVSIMLSYSHTLKVMCFSVYFINCHFSFLHCLCQTSCCLCHWRTGVRTTGLLSLCHWTTSKCGLLLQVRHMTTVTVIQSQVAAVMRFTPKSGCKDMSTSSSDVRYLSTSH